jgi:hypothetical protein
MLEYWIDGILSRTECIGLAALAIQDFVDFPNIGTRGYRPQLQFCRRGRRLRQKVHIRAFNYLNAAW